LFADDTSLGYASQDEDQITIHFMYQTFVPNFIESL
jgi:hypothetical protein